jgi:excisionase family DNA binding protein
MAEAMKTVEPGLWTTEEARQYLNISRRTLQKLYLAGDIPSMRVGGRVMFDAERLRQLVKSGFKVGRKK